MYLDIKVQRSGRRASLELPPGAEKVFLTEAG